MLVNLPEQASLFWEGTWQIAGFHIHGALPISGF